MVPVHSVFIVLVCGVIARVSSIMVPTGKIGPITPPKPIVAPAPATFARSYAPPAPVWERIDEGDSGYKPPVYNYILWDYVQRYGHHTLIPRPEDYYNPQQRVKPINDYVYKSKTPYVGKGAFSYHKNNAHYSPLQFL